MTTAFKALPEDQRSDKAADPGQAILEICKVYYMLKTQPACVGPNASFTAIRSAANAYAKKRKEEHNETVRWLALVHAQVVSQREASAAVGLF